MITGTSANRGSSLRARVKEKPESRLVIMRSVITRSGVSSSMRAKAWSGSAAVTTR
jgi:hypothetical protein